LYFKAIMHQLRFWPVLRPTADLAGGAHSDQWRYCPGSNVFNCYYLWNCIPGTVSELSHITVFFNHLCKINY